MDNLLRQIVLSILFVTFLSWTVAKVREYFRSEHSFISAMWAFQWVPILIMLGTALVVSIVNGLAEIAGQH